MRERLKQLVQERPRRGYKGLHTRLRLKNIVVNHRKV